MKPFEQSLIPLVRYLSRHSELSSDAKAAILLLPHRIRTLEAHSFLLREGDRSTTCPVLLSGYAFRHKITGDGSRQILSIHIAGDALDIQNIFLEEADHNIQMLTRGEVADVVRADLDALIRDRPDVSQALLIASLVESSIFREWTVNVGRRDARSRIAHLLCEFSYRFDADGVSDGRPYHLPMTQEQLADATGLTPVHVSRVLKALHGEGLIERDGRVLRFPDWERLSQVGEFNPRYLHVRADHSPRLTHPPLTLVQDGAAAD